MSQTHRAAITPQKGSPLVVTSRPTPAPGANEVLVKVHAVALNPVDTYQRDVGMPPVPAYPAVLGCDVAGTIASLGSAVTLSTGIQSGARVLALGTSFYHNGSPDYGAFQEFVLVPASAVVPLPDTLSFEEGAIMPLGTLTALTGWTSVGIPLSTRYTPADKQAILIWGGSSSVGSIAIQSARSMGFTVYATASPRNHDYLMSLGAHAIFDYNASDVVSQIVQAVQRDGLELLTAQVAHNGGLQKTVGAVQKDGLDNFSAQTGGLDATVAVLRQTCGGKGAQVKISHAPILPKDHPTIEGATIKFVLPPLDEEARLQHFKDVFQTWLGRGLADGSVVPSPKVQVEGRGVECVNGALDTLKARVGCAKVVVPF